MMLATSLRLYFPGSTELPAFRRSLGAVEVSLREVATGNVRYTADYNDEAVSQNSTAAKISQSMRGAPRSERVPCATTLLRVTFTRDL